MKTNFKGSERAFSLVEIVLAIVLFGLVSLAIWRLSSTSQRFNTEATSMAQQNVYATLRAQIALQGLNPTTVTNLAAPVLTDTGGTLVKPANPATDQRNMEFVRGLVTSFETSALKTASGANRAQAGSAGRTAINYQTPSLSLQTSKGIGFGYSIGSTGIAVPPPAPVPLAAPTFNISGDLTSRNFPIQLGSVLNRPSNPPGTTYHYTTDGSTPTIASQQWNFGAGAWYITGGNAFPHTVTVAAFNTDPQYSPSPSATATYTYTYTVSATFSRADGRSDLYDFTYADLQNPSAGGIVLTPSVAGATIIYTVDASTPGQTNGTVYSGAFAPAASLFNPALPLSFLVIYTPPSPDPRYIYTSAPVATSTLSPLPVPLANPIIVTSNSSSLSPGSTVNFDLNNPPAYAVPYAGITPNPGSETLSLILN